MRLQQVVSRITANPVSILFWIVSILLFALPYYLFEGKYYIGGDDTRLLYLYPGLFKQYVADSSWVTFASAGSNNPNQFLLPFLWIATILQSIVPGKVFIHYLLFSLPLFLGFVFFQKLLSELINNASNHRAVILLGGLFYVTSPILWAAQINKFLYSVFLISLIPIVCYHYVRFLKTGRLVNVLAAMFWCTVFSLAIYSIPWLAGFLLPILFSLLCCFWLYPTQTLRKSFGQTGFFIVAITISQAFWFLPFLIPYFTQGGGSAAAGVWLSGSVKDTFARTVEATSTGNVFYPLVNLFHRKLAFDFNWAAKDLYLSYYDHLAWVNIVLPLTIICGGFWASLSLEKNEKKIYLIILLAFVLSLFFFTVNIPPLNTLFLKAGSIPGIVMFRNAYDKFALGFVLLYAALFTFSLLIITRKTSRWPLWNNLFLACIGTVLVFNILPVKTLINNPLWTTSSTQTTVHISDEYLDFMEAVKNNVPPTANIISLPFGESNYTIIKEDTSDNVFAGRSPVKLFSGRNDFSGSMSFPSQISQTLRSYIQAGEYEKLTALFNTYNIHYAIVTRNIPDEVLASYLYDKKLLAAQDSAMELSLFSEKLASSQNGNYELFALKDLPLRNTLVNTPTILLHHDADILSDTQIALIGADNRIAFVQDTPPSKNKGTFYPLLEKQGQLLAEGDYNIYVPTPKSRIEWDENFQYLSVVNVFNYSLSDVPKTFSQQRQITKKIVSRDSLVMLGEDHYSLQDIADAPYPNQPHDLKVYSGAENVLKQPNALASWHTGNCHAHDDFPNIDFTETEDNGSSFLSLKANKRHNACIHQSFEVHEDELLLLSAEVRSQTQSEVTAHFARPEGGVSTKFPLEDNDWHTIEASVPTSMSGSAKLYLYSGENEDVATTEYRNIQLHKYRLTETLSSYSYNPKEPFTIPLTLDSPETVTVASDVSENIPLVLEEWSTGDCAAVDDTPSATDFIFLDNGVTLSAKNKHNACLHKAFEVAPGGQLEIKFDAFGQNHDRLVIYAGFPNGSAPFRHIEKLLPENETPVQAIIPIPNNEDSFRLYLYSGTTETGSASTTYKNIQLNQSRFSFDEAVLVKLPSEGLLNHAGEVIVDKINNHLYHLNINGLSESFFLDFKESFHPAWKIIPGHQSLQLFDTKSLPIKNTKVNGHSNGWQVDLDEVCHFKEACLRNHNGTYDLKITLVFSPQRHYLWGLLISLIGNISIVAYSIYTSTHKSRNDLFQF